MSAPTHPEGMVLLAQQCSQESRRIGELLSGQCTDDARAMLLQGFVIPAPETLAHATQIFDAVAAKPGGGWPLGSDTAVQRLDLICAFAGALDGMQQEIELDWSAAWSRYMAQANVQRVVREASDVLQRWNRGERQSLLVQVEADMKIAFNWAAWNR